MKILLINPPIRIKDPPSFFPFGIAYIASVLLKDGHDVKVLDINGYRYNESKIKEKLYKYLIKEKIDVVGIGCLITCYDYVDWLIKKIRKLKSKTKIIVGGGLGSSIPKIVLEKLNADIAVIGEGEETIKELVESFEKGKGINLVKGILYKKKGEIIENPLRERIKNLDEIPMPAWDLFPMKIYLKNCFGEIDEDDVKMDGKVMEVIPARGCPYQCTFCYDALGHNRFVRGIKKIIEEVILLKKKYGVNYILFNDPNFVVDKKWVYNLCDEIIKKELNIRWITSARADLVDKPLLRKMKQAGCLALSYGIESGSQRMLDIMRKGFTIEKAARGIYLTRKAGILDLPSFMMGFPEETEEDMEKTVEFCIKNDIHLTAIFFTTAYPKTPLYEQVKAAGLIKNEEEYIRKLGDATKFVLNLTNFSDKKLIRLKERAILKIRKSYFKKHKKARLKWYFKKIKWMMQSLKSQGIVKITQKSLNKIAIINHNNP